MKLELDVVASKTAEKPRVLVHLKFKNYSNQIIRVAKFLAGSGSTPTNNFFIIKSGKNEIPYLGMMKKRAPPDPADFLNIQPGETAEGSFDISESYPWNKTVSDYEIHYESYNHFSDTKVFIVSTTEHFRM